MKKLTDFLNESLYQVNESSLPIAVGLQTPLEFGRESKETILKYIYDVIRKADSIKEFLAKFEYSHPRNSSSSGHASSMRKEKQDIIKILFEIHYTYSYLYSNIHRDKQNPNNKVTKIDVPDSLTLPLINLNGNSEEQLIKGFETLTDDFEQLTKMIEKVYFSNSQKNTKGDIKLAKQMDSDRLTNIHLLEKITKLFLEATLKLSK